MMQLFSDTGHGNGEVLMLFSTRGLMMAFVLIAASIGTIAIAHWRITKGTASDWQNNLSHNC